MKVTIQFLGAFTTPKSGTKVGEEIRPITTFENVDLGEAQAIAAGRKSYRLGRTIVIC